MPKKKVTNIELMGIVVEYENYCKMFPFISVHQGLNKFIPRNSIVINAMSEGQRKLLFDNVEFDKDNQPIMEVISKQIIEVDGQAKEDPKYDWKYKSDEHKESFLREEKDLQNRIVEINI